MLTFSLVHLAKRKNTPFQWGLIEITQKKYIYIYFVLSTGFKNAWDFYVKLIAECVQGYAIQTHMCYIEG